MPPHCSRISWSVWLSLAVLLFVCVTEWECARAWSHSTESVYLNVCFHNDSQWQRSIDTNRKRNRDGGTNFSPCLWKLATAHTNTHSCKKWHQDRPSTIPTKDSKHEKLQRQTDQYVNLEIQLEISGSGYFGNVWAFLYARVHVNVKPSQSVSILPQVSDRFVRATNDRENQMNEFHRSENQRVKNVKQFT